MKSPRAERRHSILAAAEKLFRHYGPAKTTIGDIAEAVGIGVGSVYLEFRSKDQIVAELASSRSRRVVEAMRAASKRGSYPQRLGAALEARVDALFELADEGMHACDLVLCSNRSAFGSEELELLVELLEAGAETGELRPVDVRTTAVVMQRAYVSFSPPWLFDQDRDEAKRLVRALNRLLLHGLSVPVGASAKRRRR